MCTHVGSPKQFGGRWDLALGTVAWLTPINKLLHTCVAIQNSELWRFIKKNLTVSCRLSRSLEVIGTVTGRSANYDFLLVIHIKYGPTSYCFCDEKQ